MTADFAFTSFHIPSRNSLRGKAFELIPVFGAVALVWDGLSGAFVCARLIGRAGRSLVSPVVLVVEGAHWMEQSAEYLRVAGTTWVEILDFYHARQHIWSVATAWLRTAQHA